MPIRATTLRTILAGIVALLPSVARAEDIDTEHLFGFMIGSDVGTRGEREFQSETMGRFGKGGGTYRTVGQQIELEFVPARNFRVEVGSAFAAYDINGVSGIDDARRLALQGASLDLRYRLLGREAAPFGLTVAVESHANRIDETTSAAVRNFGTEFTLAFDRELIPGKTVASFNLIYQPEWTRLVGHSAVDREATIGASFGIMTRLSTSFFLGGEARYLRKYEGVDFGEFSDQAFFIGPTAYFQISERSRLTAAWSLQVWGRAAGSYAVLDTANFERHQARLVFGVNF